MNRKIALGLTVIVALFAASTARAAEPPVQVLSVVNQAHVNPYTLRAVERAVQRQVVTARRWWSIPRVRFGPGGWKVTLVSGVPAACGEDDGGCHSGTTEPWGVVTTSEKVSGAPWATTFDHEILEMLTNPGTLLFDYGQVEICDVTEHWNYWDRGVWLSDFALPEAYASDPHGRVDFDRDVSARAMRSELAFDGAVFPIAIAPAA